MHCLSPNLKTISAGRFTKLYVTGFIAFLAAILDDTIACMAIFTGEGNRLISPAFTRRAAL